MRRVTWEDKVRAYLDRAEIEDLAVARHSLGRAISDLTALALDLPDGLDAVRADIVDAVAKLDGARVLLSVSSGLANRARRNRAERATEKTK